MPVARPCSFVYLWSMVTFVLLQWSGVVETKAYSPQSHISIFNIWPITGKFADHCNTCSNNFFRIKNYLKQMCIVNLGSGRLCWILHWTWVEGAVRHGTNPCTLWTQHPLIVTLQSIYLPITWKWWKDSLKYRVDFCQSFHLILYTLTKWKESMRHKFRDRRYLLPIGLQKIS